jgi:hypothetical protein
MPRTSHSGPRQACPTTAELRAQRRRARVIDDGSRIILSHPSTAFEVTSSTSRSPQNLDSDCLTYLDVSHERWDGIVAPGRSRSSSVGALPPPTTPAGPLAGGDEGNAWSSRQRPSKLEPLIEDSSSPNAHACSELKPLHYRCVRHRDHAPLDGGRWVLDPKSGFEMYVPPSSPRRHLRPRMRSMPAPPRCAGEIRSPQPPLKRTTVSRHNLSEKEGDDVMRRQEWLRCPIPPAPQPMPPSLAQFWESDVHLHPPPAYESAPTNSVAVRDRPLLDPGEERERQFLALLARDCGSGASPQEIAGTSTATHRSNASKISSRRSAGITGKLSSGLAMGIPSFFRARRNTTAAQINKQ